MGDLSTALLLVILTGALVAIRHAVRAELAILVDAIEAVAAAGAGITVAATSREPLVIGAAVAIGFAAIVQQYAARVHGQLARDGDRHGDVPLGLLAMLGFGAFFAIGQPPLLLVALACACMVSSAVSAITRGVALWRAEGAIVRPPILPPLAGRARWQRLGDGLASARDTAFWGVVVARPLARVVLQAIAEQRWITPNRVTAASIAACAGAAIAIVDAAVVTAIVLIGIRSVLDSVDGQLARYRGCGTRFGSYVDKVSDLFCWGALFAALGVRAHAVEHAAAYLLLPLLAALMLALLGMALWLARALAPVSAPAPAPAPSTWAANLWRIVLFEEPDFYLWIALAIATARYDVFIPLIAGAYVIRALVLAMARVGRLKAKESPA